MWLFLFSAVFIFLLYLIVMFPSAITLAVKYNCAYLRRHSTIHHTRKIVTTLVCEHLTPLLTQNGYRLCFFAPWCINPFFDDLSRISDHWTTTRDALRFKLHGLHLLQMCCETCGFDEMPWTTVDVFLSIFALVIIHTYTVSLRQIKWLIDVEFGPYFADSL